MSTLDAFLAVWATIGCLGWCWLSLGSLWRLRQIAILERLTPAPPERWPKLSVIIAARDEAEDIREALSSLLEQDYPALEVVVANDRSRDATGAILDEIAGREPRLSPVHITVLPDGWLGKVHAMHRASEAARGDWLLFTDADVHFAPGVLRRTIAHALGSGLDHLAVAPAQAQESFWTRVMISAFAVMFFTATRAHRVGKPGSQAYIGVGAFNLVERETLERTEGFDWLRMEVADDVGLGLMLHRHGARTGFALSTGDIRLTWYRSVAEMVDGLAKNSFGPGTGYRYSLQVAQVVAVLAIALAPLVALLAPWPIPIAAAAAYGSLLLSAVVNAPLTRSPILPSLLFPIGLVVMAYTMARSAWLCWRQGGIRWRDTHYSIEELRAGQRVRL